MRTVEETIVVSAPVYTAYELWDQFAQMPAFLSGARASSAEGDWGRPRGQSEQDVGSGARQPDLRIAWRTVEGDSYTGAILFTPLDAVTTRILARIEWPTDDANDDSVPDRSITGAEVREALRQYGQFIETP